MEKKEKLVFDYQRFLKEQKIDIKSLPKHLKKMIRLIEKHLRDAHQNCNEDQCREIISLLQEMADHVMDELFNYMEERDAETEVEEKSNDKKPPLSDKDIIDLQYQGNKRQFTTTELKELGLKHPLDQRYILIDRYCLVHDLFKDNWHLFQGSEIEEK